METVHGIYIDLVVRNHVAIGFRCRVDADCYMCTGLTISMPRNIPVTLTAERTSDRELKVIDMHLDDANREGMIKFLSGRGFSGVGKVTAGHLYDAMRHECITSKTKYMEQLSDASIRQALNECKIHESVHAKYLYAIKKIPTVLDTMQKLKQYGSTEKDAELAYEKYGEDAISILKSSPYAGIHAGIRFQVCEAIAYDNKIQQYDMKRVSALCSVLSDYIAKSGGCCIKFFDATAFLMKIQKASKYEIIPKGYLVAFLLADKRYVIVQTKNYGVVIYPSELYEIEQNIGSEILRLIRSSSPHDIDEDSISDILDPEQKNAVKMQKNSGVKILTGGPGTGKTTVIREIIRIHDLSENEPVFLCAPTGRAAVRMTEVVGGNYRAQTIHKMLGVRNIGDNQYICSYTKSNQMPKGLFVVDEMSMVDEKIFYHLLQAIPNGSTIILSGDPNQLPSVSSGTVLKDLMESGIIESTELKTVHRQKDGNSIIDNYYHILKDDPNLEKDDDFQVFSVNSDAEVIRTLSLLYRKYNSTDPRKFQILTTTRKGKVGKYAIDLMVETSKKQSVSKDTYCPMTDFAIGDKIMMTANKYDRGYWNGDVGIITAVADDSVTVQFDEESRVIERDWFEDMEHAWATTVHKAQGAEYETVIIILDNTYQNMLFNSIILTAITRAKKKCFVITKNNALNLAITTHAETKRMTGLREILQELYSVENIQKIA